MYNCTPINSMSKWTKGVFFSCFQDQKKHFLKNKTTTQISVFRSSVRSHATHAIGELKNSVHAKFWEVFLGGKTIFLGLQIWGDLVHVQCHS